MSSSTPYRKSIPFKGFRFQGVVAQIPFRSLKRFFDHSKVRSRRFGQQSVKQICLFCDFILNDISFNMRCKPCL